MKHLCYVYIYEYKCLKNIELVLDSHYSYKFEPDKKALNITKNKDFPENFWGNTIYSVAALVGNNGSGKSTAMSFLLDFLFEWSSNHSVNGVVVFENSGELYYYGNVSSASFEGNFIESNPWIRLNEVLGRIPCFYYSGHFSPYINNDPRNRCFAGGYFASDIVRLVEDFPDDIIEDSIQLSNYLSSHIAQNNYRICMMLANEKFSGIIKDFSMPKYVIIRINQSGESSIKSSIKKENMQREQILNNIINNCHSIAGLYTKLENDNKLENEKKALEYYEKAKKATDSKLGTNRPGIVQETLDIAQEIHKIVSETGEDVGEIKDDVKEIKDTVKGIANGKTQSTGHCLTSPPSDAAPSNVIGREKDLDGLWKMLSEKKHIMLTGLGGIGKTKLAQLLFHNYMDRFDEVAWIDYKGSLRQSFLYRIEDYRDRNDPWEAMMNDLHNDGKTKLFIVDKVDDDTNQHPLSDRELRNLAGWENTTILLTSRLKEELRPYFQYELKALDKNDCIAVFNHYYGSEPDPELVRKIVALAHYHTFTIELLAKGAKQENLASYYEKIKKEFDGVARRFGTQHHDGNVTIEGHLKSLFDIQKRSEADKKVLNGFAVLPVNCECSLEEIRQWFGFENRDLDDLIQDGWLLYDEGKQVFSMHPLVRTIVRFDFVDDAQGHKKTIAPEGTIDKILECFSEALFDIGDGNLLLQRKIDIAESVISAVEQKETVMMASVFHNIGYGYYFMGDYDRALEYYWKALEIRESKLGKDRPDTASTYNNIAAVCYAKGDYDRALEYYWKALEIREFKLGKDHPETATTYNNIALVYQAKGDYDKALEHYEKALEIVESKLGKDHPYTATTYNNIAGVYQAKGDYDNALEYYWKALEIRESKLGKDHPNTASIYNNIAGVYYANGDYDKALEYFNKTLEIVESKLGKDHINTITINENIAAVYHDKGEFVNALKYYEKAKEMKMTKPEMDYQETITNDTIDAKEYEKRGDYEKAIQLYEEDLRINEEKLNKVPYSVTITSFKKVFDSSTENHFWSQMIYHNLLNFSYYNGIWRNGFDIIDNWQKQLNNNDVPVLDQFSDYIDSIFDDEKKETLKSLKNILQETKKLSTYKTDSSDNGFLCIDCKKNNNNLVNLGEKVLNNELFMTSKLFDFSYAQALESETILSSGEQELLNLFSRIYDAIELRSKGFTKTESSCLVMLDEAEIGFHPDWQRRYLNLVIEFLNKLGAIKKKGLDFQIIISTHSPILLSDIPKCCTNYLKVDNGKTINANRDEIGETFASNVFNLYRMSFFMKDGLVGEFAREKITKLEKRIEKGETKNIVQEINMIGDEGIREYLLESFYQKHPEKNSINERLIEYYKNKISQLQKGKEYKDE